MLLFVAQNLVSSIDFFKQMLISSLIRMVLYSQFSVSLLDFLFICSLLNSQDFVEFCSVDGLPASPSRHASGHATPLSEVFEWNSSKHTYSNCLLERKM